MCVRMCVRVLSTTTQRDALSGIDASTVIDNITIGSLEKFDGTSWVNTAGSVIDSDSNINVSGTTALTSRIRTMRYQAAAAAGAMIQAGHSRGTEGSPTALNSGDELGEYVFLGDNGTNQTAVGPVIRGKTTEAWDGSSRGSGVEVAVIKNTETTETIAMTFSSNGFPVLPIHTVATLPTAEAAGLIYVSDETGGATLAFSDGTNWRRVQNRAIVS